MKVNKFFLRVAIIKLVTCFFILWKLLYV